MDLINGLELLSWMFSVRFAGTAYAVREDILKMGWWSISLALPQILLKSELGGGRVGQATRLRCDSAGTARSQHGFCCTHILGAALHSVITFRPSWIQNRPRALSTRVLLLFCTLLGPIYLMVLIRAVLMPQNYIALLNFAVVGETIIKVVWQIPW